MTGGIGGARVADEGRGGAILGASASITKNEPGHCDALRAGLRSWQRLPDRRSRGNIAVTKIIGELPRAQVVWYGRKLGSLIRRRSTAPRSDPPGTRQPNSMRPTATRARSFAGGALSTLGATMQVLQQPDHRERGRVVVPTNGKLVVFKA